MMWDAFLDEFIKIAYLESVHLKQQDLISRGIAGSGRMSKALKGHLVSGNVSTDEGIRHPWIPTNDYMHAFPTRPRAQVVKRLNKVMDLGVRDVAEAAANPGTFTSGILAVKGFQDIGQAGHTLADLTAHYDRPLKKGELKANTPAEQAVLGMSRQGRKVLQKIPGAGALGFAVSGAEHALSGLPPGEGILGLAPGIDTATGSKIDKNMLEQSKRFGNQVRVKILKTMQTEHGFKPDEAEKALGKFLRTTDPGLGADLVGSVARDARHVGYQITRPARLLRRVFLPE